MTEKWVEKRGRKLTKEEKESIASKTEIKDINKLLTEKDTTENVIAYRITDIDFGLTLIKEDLKELSKAINERKLRKVRRHINVIKAEIYKILSYIYTLNYAFHDLLDIEEEIRLIEKRG